MSSLPFSALLSWSQLFSSLLMSPELFSSLLISSQLFSAFLKFSQLVSTLLGSPQLLSAHLVPSQLFSPPLTPSKPTSPQLISDLVRSSRLISALLSALSNHLIFSLAQNLLQKRISTPKQATPTLFTEKISHRRLLHTASFCTEKLGHTLLHSEAIAHSKLSHRESFTGRSFCTQQTLTHSKLLHTASCHTKNLLHTEPFTHSELLHTASLQTENLLHTEPFTHSKLLHTANLHTQPALTQKSSFTHSKLLHREAFTQSWGSFFSQTAFTHSQLVHRGAFSQRSNIKNLVQGRLSTQQASKLRKSRDKSLTIATLVQPRQYDSRCPAPKDKSITHAAAAPSNLDAAVTMRSAQTELQSLIELRATAWEIAAPKWDLDAKAKQRRFWSTFKKKFKKDNHQRQNWENLVTNHYRSLDAGIPIRFAMSSSKRLK